MRWYWWVAIGVGALVIFTSSKSIYQSDSEGKFVMVGGRRIYV